MKICLINPNSTEAMNAAVLASAQRAAAQLAGVELSALCVAESPALINSDAGELQAAYWTMQKARTLAGSFDAFVIACHSDPGVDAVAEVTGKPVMGIGRASIDAALAHPGRAMMLVINAASIPRKERVLARLGLTDRFAIVPTGYTEQMSAAQTVECLTTAARRAQQAAPCTSIVLGCAGMGSAAPALQRALGLPVIDGTEEAVRRLAAGWINPTN